MRNTAASLTVKEVSFSNHLGDLEPSRDCLLPWPQTAWMLCSVCLCTVFPDKGAMTTDLDVF